VLELVLVLELELELVLELELELELMLVLVIPMWGDDAEACGAVAANENAVNVVDPAS
jgi:hypothetical protein